MYVQSPGAAAIAGTPGEGLEAQSLFDLNERFGRVAAIGGPGDQAMLMHFGHPAAVREVTPRQRRILHRIFNLLSDAPAILVNCPECTRHLSRLGQQ